MRSTNKDGAIRVYRAMRSDYKHDAGKYWNFLSFLMRWRLEFSNFKRGFAARHYSAYSPELTMYRTSMWLLYQRIVEDGGASYFSPSHHQIGNAEVLQFEGRQVSWEQLLSVNEAMLLHRNLGRKFRSCLEIGAGYGRTAELLIQHTPLETYAIVDLPESLALSHYYLRRIFPEMASHYLDTRDARGGGLFFSLPNQIHRLKGQQFDLGLNINGFQEMPRSEIVRYLSLFAQTCKVVFFSNKTKTYKLDHDIVTDIQDYPIPDSWECVYSKRSEVYDSYVNQIYRVH